MEDRPPEPDDGGTELDPTAPQMPAARAGASLGPYVLLERIGRGGMGEVWKAEQTGPLQRTVALKLVRPEMGSREVIARFVSERRALALMDHPCIAKVHDAAATPDGWPYFVMEYVPGVPITEYCDQRRLSVDERLGLFRRVCDGVGHAHQKAIIHRDLKPSNILVVDVDGRPVPKIIDFGVAKAVTAHAAEPAVHTRIGQMIGTAEYISPEQADLTGEDVDTRSDVYSLGVVLYEMLAGCLPFGRDRYRTGGLAGIVRLLREEDPPRPSARVTQSDSDTEESARRRRTGVGRLIRDLEGDLDWIVMRCLEKDRNRRYGSTQELSQDIRRHLRHQPVEARPPSLGYRARRFARRHRVGVGIVAAGFAVLVGVAITTSVQSARVATERDRANREAMLAGEVSDFLVDLFRIADPRAARGNTVTAREILDRGAERIGGSDWSDPRVQTRLLHVMGEVYQGLGLAPEARSLYERALALDTEFLGETDPETLESRFRVAMSQAVAGEYDAAEAGLRSVLAEQAQVLGRRHRATSSTLRGLAHLLRNTGRVQEAEPLYDEALAIQREILGPDDPHTIRTENELGILYWSQGRYEEAEPLLTESLRRAEQHFGSDDPRTLTYRNNMAAFEHTVARGRDAGARRVRAERLYRECLDTQRRILGSEHPETLRTIYNLGSLLLADERYGEAVPLLQEAAGGRARVLGPSHRATLLARINLAHVLRKSGEVDRARSLLDSVLVAQRAVLDPYHREIRFTVSELYELHRDAGRTFETRRTLGEYLSILRHDATAPNASAEAHERYARTLLGGDFADLRDAPTALDHALEADRLRGHVDPAVLETLGRAYAATGDTARARRAWEDAVALLPESDPRRADMEEALRRVPAPR